MLFAPFSHLLVWFITTALICAFCSTHFDISCTLFSYMIFVIFSPWTKFLDCCFPHRNCVNRDKTGFATIHLKFLHIQNFSTSKITPHLKCLHYVIASATNIKYHYSHKTFPCFWLLSFLHYLVCVPREVNIGVPCVVSRNILKSYA